MEDLTKAQIKTYKLQFLGEFVLNQLKHINNPSTPFVMRIVDDAVVAWDLIERQIYKG